LTSLPLGISLGDPAGVGPEVVARALAARPELDVVVYGDVGVLERAAAAAGVGPPDPARVKEVTRLPPEAVTFGQPNEASGRAQVQYLTAAARAALAGEISALCTAPISKAWAARAGFAFPGHTEFLAQMSGTREFAMMLAGPRLKVTVVTTHVALRDVPRLLTVAAIETAIRLTTLVLRDGFGVALPRVAVAGLNPHAGEEGRFGDEEARLVLPAIAEAQRRLAAAHVSARVSGPHVPDAVFRHAATGEVDAVVALYHDQGLIPIKLLDFDEAVNLTLGLPFPRTSPDHGTAYDIAGTGRARPRSMLAALDLAAVLAEKSLRRPERT
jgi:4-hydroxythreonine-4-phosphate dehydrogenase